MSKPTETDPNTSDKRASNATELEKLKARHDAVHHMPGQNSGGGLIVRGKSLEDEWIRREEKRKAEEANVLKEKAKGKN